MYFVRHFEARWLIYKNALTNKK